MSCSLWRMFNVSQGALKFKYPTVRFWSLRGLLSTTILVKSSRATRRYSRLAIGIIPLAYCSVHGTSDPRTSGDDNPDPIQRIQQLLDSAYSAVGSKKYGVAEVKMHEALHICNTIKNSNVLLHLYDGLGNLYFVSAQYEKALSSFTELIRLLVILGVSETDTAIVDVSLKLANIYIEQNKIEEADTGFLFCVESQAKNVSRDEDELNMAELEYKTSQKSLEDKRQLMESRNTLDESRALYGMVLESYARFLAGQNKLPSALMNMEKACDLSKSVFGSKHHQSIVLLNNYASLCMSASEYKRAVDVLKEVIEFAPYVSELEESIPMFYCNLAEALWRLKCYRDAIEKSRKAVSMAKRLNDDNTLKNVQEFSKRLEIEFKRLNSASASES